MKVSISKFVRWGVLLAGMVFPASAANIVANPGFETGTFLNWNTDASGNWQVDTLLPHTGIFEAVTFCNIPVCISTPVAFISQDLTTAIGTKYALSFWYNNELSPPGPGGNELQVLAGGVLLADLINQPVDTTYRKLVVAFTATALTTTIQFNGMSAQNFLTLDDVCVDVNNVDGACGVAGVPEPSSLLFTGSSALVLLGLRRLRLKQRA